MPKKTDAFLMLSGTAHRPELKHLHIVCTNPDAQGNVLLVSVTKWKNNLCDASCILNSGDHAFIKHKSWICYRNARIFPHSEIIKGIEQGRITAESAFAPAIFQRIYNGFLSSPHAKKKIINYLRRNSFAEKPKSAAAQEKPNAGKN